MISLISIFRNVQDDKLVWDTVTHFFFNGLFVNYALLKKRGLVKVKTAWSTWKRILFFHNMHIKSSFVNRTFQSNRLISIYYNSAQNNRPQYEALGNKTHKLCIYSSEPRTEVYCFRMNFNISKLGYSLAFEFNFVYPTVQKSAFYNFPLRKSNSWFVM